jgi:hypothetical protein
MPAPTPPSSPTPEQEHALAGAARNALLGWRVANFKAFGREPQSIPLAPLTLIFGPNSAGKSSALHSLLFAHEAVTSGELDIYAPKLAEGAVDLGGFAQLTFCQRTDTHPLTFEYDLRPDLLNALFRRVLGADTTARATKVTLVVVLALIPDGDDLDSAAGRPALRRLDVLLDGHSFCQVGREGDGALTFRTLDLEHPFFAGVRASYAELLKPQTANPAKVGDRVLALCNDVFPRTILCFDDGLLPTAAILDETENQDEPPLEAGRAANEAATQRDLYFFFADDPDAGAISVLMPRFADLLGEIVRDACLPLQRNLEALTYLGPLRSFPDRDFTLTHARDAHWHAGGGFAWDVLARDDAVRAKVNAWFGSDLLQTPYEFVVTDLVSGEIVTSAIESEFADIVQEKYHEHESARGSKQSEDDEKFYFPYDAWDTDALGKRLTEKALERARSSRRMELRLMDKRTRARVSHRDVGVGLSQILPILVRAVSSQDGLHLIEQPEIHVHPRLQAELGDVFINSALGGNRNRFIVETHSENLILRVLRRVRETSLRKNIDRPAVRADDICLLYVDPTPQGAIVRRIRVDDRSRLQDPVPGGFFEENFGEMFA